MLTTAYERIVSSLCVIIGYVKGLIKPCFLDTVLDQHLNSRLPVITEAQRYWEVYSFKVGHNCLEIVFLGRAHP